MWQKGLCNSHPITRFLRKFSDLPLPCWLVIFCSTSKFFRILVIEMPAGFLLWCLCFIIADILAYILDILSKRVREIHHALPLSVSNTLNSEYRTTTPLYLLSIWVFFWCQNTVVCEDDQVVINFVSFICRTICFVLSRYSIELQNWASPVTITIEKQQLFWFFYYTQ